MHDTMPGRRCAVALLPGALLLLANADPVPTPGIAERYARADRYLRPEIDKLIVNADLRATFTRDGTGIRDYIHAWDLAKAHVRAVERFDEVIEEDELRPRIRLLHRVTAASWSSQDSRSSCSFSCGPQMTCCALSSTP